MPPLQGLVAVVTGGASGLGRGTVETLVRAGANVTILDLPSSKGADLAKELGQNVLFAPTNVGGFIFDEPFIFIFHFRVIAHLARSVCSALKTNISGCDE